MILDGKLVSGNLKDTLLNDILELKKMNIIPKLAIILVGHSEESLVYINMKRKMCEELGIQIIVYHFLESVLEGAIIEKIEELNKDNLTHGILIQLPLPKHFNKEKLLDKISYQKDADGFHTINAGKIFQANDINVIPCTPLGCIDLLDHYNIDVKGLNVAIIGTSNLVGLPLSMLLLQRGATITLCNINTKNVKEHTIQSDMIIACCGVPHLIKSDWVKEGAIVIDIGINRIKDVTKKNGHRLVGDVDFDGVKDKCKYITPVPGGIGPMTVISLMKNIIKLAKNTYTKL